MSGLTKRVRGASAHGSDEAAGVRGGGHSSRYVAPPSAALVEQLLSAFTDDVGPRPGERVAGEGDR